MIRDSFEYFDEYVVEEGSEVEFLLSSFETRGCCSGTINSLALPRIAVTPFGAAEDAAKMSRSADFVGGFNRKLKRVYLGFGCSSTSTSTLLFLYGSP